jgi:hypothetical protein
MATSERRTPPPPAGARGCPALRHRQVEPTQQRPLDEREDQRRGDRQGDDEDRPLAQRQAAGVGADLKTVMKPTIVAASMR